MMNIKIDLDNNDIVHLEQMIESGHDYSGVLGHILNAYKNSENKLSPGSYADGSLRNEDLIPKFISLLIALDDDEYVKNIYLEIGQNVVTYSDCSIWDSEVINELCNDLMDRLDEFVPENYYFGAHPDNGSDFGVWENEI